MKTLITGGAGFIGSHLAEALLARGDEVLVIDNYATGRRDNLRPHPKLTVVEGSIVDASTVDGAFASFAPTHVVHAAASYKDPHDWVEDVRTNGLGGVNVIKAAQKAGVKRVVYFQTALCYGTKPREQPVTLSHPRYPDCSYAISKTIAEEYLEMSGLDFVTFRLANIIGPRNLSGPVPTFYKRLTAGQDCSVFKTRRDFVFVGDLVQLVLLALGGKGAKGTYHAATGSDYAIKELYDGVAAALKITKPAPEKEPAPDDAKTILLDPSRTHEQFGWRATTPLAETIRQAVAWYQANGVGQTYTHLKHEAAKA
jgi:UDP-glucose 4-epimerase